MTIGDKLEKVCLIWFKARKKISDNEYCYFQCNGLKKDCKYRKVALIPKIPGEEYKDRGR